MEGRAQVFVGPGRPFESRTFPFPEVEPNGMVVRVSTASVCGTDLHIWHGRRNAPLPIILGHEATGTIAKKGRELKGDSAGQPVEEGDRISWSYVKTCNECYYCKVLKEPTGCLNRFVYGLWASCESPPHFNGAFSEYIYLRPGTSFFKVPAGLSESVVAPANCALVTMVHVMEKASLKINETVVVQGCGPLGLYAIALAKELGARRVVALDLSDLRLDFARSFGADEAIDVGGLSEAEIVSRIKDATDGLGADVGVEASGVPNVIPLGLKLVRDGGRYFTVGPIFQGASAEIDLFNLIFRRVSLVGVARNDARHLLEALRFLARTKDRYPYEKIVGIRVPLEDLGKAFEAVDRKEVMRAAVVIR